jgi:hypothetical protein
MDYTMLKDGLYMIGVFSGINLLGVFSYITYPLIVNYVNRKREMKGGDRYKKLLNVNNELLEMLGRIEDISENLNVIKNKLNEKKLEDC